jgi:hypothetical protein
MSAEQVTLASVIYNLFRLTEWDSYVRRMQRSNILAENRPEFFMKCMVAMDERYAKTHMTDLAIRSEILLRDRR